MKIELNLFNKYINQIKLILSFNELSFIYLYIIYIYIINLKINVIDKF